MIKLIILLAWGLVVANFFVAMPAAMVTPLKLMGVFLVIAHLAEYFIFRKAIAAKGDGGLKSFVMTFLFGLAYIKGL